MDLQGAREACGLVLTADRALEIPSSGCQHGRIQSVRESLRAQHLSFVINTEGLALETPSVHNVKGNAILNDRDLC